MLPFTLRRRCVDGFNKLVKCYGCSNSTRASYSSSSSTTSSISYCVDLVRKFDYENFLCTILLPNQLKATAFAIRAFNIELSLIQKQVTESHIMPVRFKFWEERIDDIYNNRAVNHPVVIELKNAVNRHKLPKVFLKKLVKTREMQCHRATFKTMREMEEYANHSNSPVYMLLLEASGVKNLECDHVASHLGIAQGLTNLMRALPHNLKDRLILFPTDILAEHSVSEEELFRMEFEPETLCNLVFEVAQVANAHIKKVQSMEKNVPRDTRIIFLPAVAVAEYLENLENCRFNLYNGKVEGINAIEQSRPKVTFINKLGRQLLVLQVETRDIQIFLTHPNAMTHLLILFISMKQHIFTSMLDVIFG